MATIRIRPRYDTDPAELLLTRCATHLRMDRKRALRASDLQDVNAIDTALRTVAELLRIVKQDAAENWKLRKAA